MSSTKGPSTEDVMAWDPKNVADYMRQLKLFNCDTVVLKRGITGAQFLNTCENTKRPQRAREEEGFWFEDSESDDYEEYDQEEGEVNYIVPLIEPHTAETLHKAKAREDNRFQPVFSLPEPQRASNAPCYATAHLSKFQPTTKKPEKPPPRQRAFSHLTEGSVAVATGSLSSRRPLPIAPQLNVSNRANNLIPHAPVPTQRVRLNQSIRTSGIKNVQGLDPSWYMGRMTRAQAEVSLWEVNKDGAFLVRDSSHGSTHHPYTLMLLYQGKIYNIKIQRQNNFYFLGSGTNNTMSFLRVKEMIIHHMNTPLVLIDATDQCPEEQPQCCLLHPARL